MGRFQRVGGVLASPRSTLAALDRDSEGSGIVGDAIALLVVRFLATELPLLISIVWAGWVVSGRFALFQVLTLFQKAIVSDLILILIASVAVSVLAGRKRRFDRDVELGAACWMPFMVIETLAWLIEVVAKALGKQPLIAIEPLLSEQIRTVMWTLALAWSVVLMVLAVRVARRRETQSA